MTREEKLYSMRGAELIKEAEKLGVTVSHKGNALKESKASAIQKILAAEVLTEEFKDVPEAFQPAIETGTEILQEVEESPAEEAETPAEEPKTKERKKSAKKENPERDAFINAFTELTKKYNYIAATYEKVGPSFVVLRTEEKGKIKYEFYLGQKGVRINLKPAIAEELGLDHDTIKNYYLPAVVRFRYSADAVKTTETILAYN